MASYGLDRRIQNKIIMRRWWSGLTHETVNLAAYAFAGSNPARRTTIQLSGREPASAWAARSAAHACERGVASYSDASPPATRQNTRLRLHDLKVVLLCPYSTFID